VTIPNLDCNFSYRNSRFNSADRNRFMITGISLHLLIGNPQPPFYSALASYLEKHDIKDITPKTIREAVVAIRQSKLPDPKIVANNGSFFANPIIDKATFQALYNKYPDIAHWEVNDNQEKISAAWLVEKAGFKDYHDSETGMGTWPKHSLILINEHAKSTADLLKFKQKIIDGVKQLSGITLIQEPELLP
jgi:UDP-N-acetylmuramate dehydrogenase